jgi:lysophospholipase L1-like esterase
MTRFRTIAAVAASALVVVAIAACSSAEPGKKADETPTASPRSGTVVGFYGDSYTAGEGASDPTKRWSTIISAERGWHEYNRSVSGLGFVNNRRTFGDGDLPDLIIREKPDIVIVTMGLNDNFSFEVAADTIHQQIDADITRLHDELPEARLIVVEPFWYTDDRPRSVDIINGWVADAAASVGAEHIAGASHWIEGHPEWMAEDGLHPNDAGYAAIAERMDDALTELGL